MKLFLSILLTFFTLTTEATVEKQIYDTILNSKEIPGNKTEIAKTWDTLVKNGVFEVQGCDQEVRPYFVAIQAAVEHVLSLELKRSVYSLCGIIHTPMPATPLCTAGEISKDLVDPSIENDPLRLYTVKARATILRDYLQQGGILYIAYPGDGFAKRTVEQQNIYKNELQKYPNNLIDCPLQCTSIPTDLIGATYFFTDENNKTFVFAIKMTQAKDPQEQGNFGLWFGPIDDAVIKTRVTNVLDFLRVNNPVTIS